jgi:hypothetical protein
MRDVGCVSSTHNALICVSDLGNIVRMTQAETIAQKFGGVAALARALGHRHPTTVQGWVTRGFIPARQQQAVLTAAQKNAVDVSPADFFPTTEAAA